jgi:hypothetical protein
VSPIFSPAPFIPSVECSSIAISAPVVEFDPCQDVRCLGDYDLFNFA